MSSPRFHVPECSGDAGDVRLPSDEAFHATRVLRLTAGAAVRVFDGRGREWSGVLTSADRDRVTVAIGAPVSVTPEPSVRVTLAVSLLKGDQMDAVVRDATVMGAAVISPIVTAHTVVSRSAWRAGTAVDRWHRIAVAAAKQCGRAVVPVVEPVAEWRPESFRDEVMIFALEPAHADAWPLDVEGLGRPAAARLCIGPEGGWSESEVQVARDLQARTLRLGPRTLRAESVPVVALTALWTVWGWT